MTKRYKVILFVRFLGYLLFFTGLLSCVFILGPLVQAEAKYRVDRVLGVKRTIAQASIVSNPNSESNPESNPEASAGDAGGTASFGSVKATENEIVPVSTKFGLVIEKINANAKVIADVDTSNERAYSQALVQGVAQALGSTPPGQPGNLYLFSHSTDAPWNIIRFNAIFYLLRELEAGDRIIVFYEDKRYDYIVFDKTIAAATDVSYLTNKYQVPVLTLQTCDPPGTLINRLIVRAKLVNT